VVVSYATGIDTIVGDNLVNSATGTPLEFPPPSLSPIYIKPVTVLYVSTIIFVFSLTSLLEETIMRASRTYLNIGLLVFFLVSSISFYEIFFNFSLWDAIMVQQIHSSGTLNPDAATNVYPLGGYAINLVFATKVFTSIFISSAFVAFIFWRALSQKKASEVNA
jgi:hypothetical protein